MEITESMVYWITRLDGIRAYCIALAVVSALIAVLPPVIYVIGCVSGDEKKVWSKLKRPHTILITLVFLVFSATPVFVPTTKEMCAIKIIPVVAQNEDIQEIPPKIAELANEWIEELKPDTKQ